MFWGHKLEVRKETIPCGSAWDKISFRFALYRRSHRSARGFHAGLSQGQYETFRARTLVRKPFSTLSTVVILPRQAYLFVRLCISALLPWAINVHCLRPWSKYSSTPHNNNYINDIGACTYCTPSPVLRAGKRIPE